MPLPIRWTAALAPLLLLTACAYDAPERVPVPSETETAAPTPQESTPPDIDFSAFNQGEIPAERPEGDLSALPAAPDESASLSDRLAWEALREVTEFADRVDPDASASCPEISGEAGESVTCTVEFYGKQYGYDVFVYDSVGTGITDGQNESGYVTYKAELTSAPVFRDRIESLFRFQYETDYAICDMDDHVRVPFTELNTEPSPIRGVHLLTGFECRVLDAETGEVTAIELVLRDTGSPDFPQDSY
ncbi:hypothetical protein [Glycomyces tarimensis]